MSIVTGFIFILGIATVILSIAVAFKFWGYANRATSHRPTRLSRGISWQLFGEAVIGLGTLIFATAAHFDYLKNWSIELQSSLRFIMFLATSVTTFHLLLVLNSNEKQN